MPPASFVANVGNVQQKISEFEVRQPLEQEVYGQKGRVVYKWVLGEGWVTTIGQGGDGIGVREGRRGRLVARMGPTGTLERD